MSSPPLRRGDVVEVRTAAEILDTLDEQGRLDELPFMPEMVSYCGRRFTVERRADKLCDTIATLKSRRIPDAVLLDDLRCDGSGHGGCQAECRFYFKEVWLRRVEPDEPATEVEPSGVVQLTERVTQDAAEREDDGPVRYRCQATQMVAASHELSTFAPGPYVDEYRSGNVPLGTFVRVMTRAAVTQPLHRAKLLPVIHVKGASERTPETEVLDLQPGEWVRVKSRDDIAETLTVKGRNRGLWFDREMLPYCGGVFRVRQRITRIIEESTGRMLELSRDCVTLEGVVCSGERSTSRWFCPRAIPCYWRECWLERVGRPPVEG